MNPPAPLIKPELMTVVDELVNLLSECGELDRANWLRDRRDALASANQSMDGVETTLAQIHKIVLGMGGLLDLHLRPPNTSLLSSTEVNHRMDVLADRLYRLTAR